jgi:hypothetical protein
MASGGLFSRVKKGLHHPSKVEKIAPVDQLCRTCTNLELSAEDFIVQPPIREHSNRARLHSFELGTFRDIFQRVNCPLCRLIKKAVDVPENEQYSRNDLSICQLEWIQDGREVTAWGLHGPVTTPKTRRLRILSSSKGFPDAYIMLVAPKGLPNTKTAFLGRPVKGEHIDIEQLRQWIKACNDNHCAKGGICGQALRPDFEELVCQPWFRVVDVDSMTIVSEPKGRFLALSYIWGGTPTFTTTTSNIDQVSSEGGLGRIPGSLPRTIEDAIRLTKLLGERYLWVDALCIIQDEAEDRMRNIEVMDLIFGGAFLTICAATQKDSNIGLCGLDPIPRIFNQHIEECSPDLQLMGSRIAESYIRDSIWNTRAWTFQERHMSTRCLIFVEGRVYFQCKRSIICEDIHSNEEYVTEGLGGWSLELSNAPYRLFQEENPLRQYNNSVKLYTTRSLTFSSDVLKAFRGIEKVLAMNLCTVFVCGLPRAYFDWALLWEPQSLAKNRDDKSMRKHELSALSVHRRNGFPSWSWAGWIIGAEYKPSTVSGTLINLHNWLSEHTWIVWYMSTPHTNTARLLWKGESKMSLSGQWKGYPEKPSGRAQVVDEDGAKRPTVPLREPKFVTESISEEGEQHLLQFWTHSAYFHLTEELRHESSPFPSNIGDGLRRYGIADNKGNWCGTITLPKFYNKNIDAVFHFVAISDAREFSMEEHDSWTYYVPRGREDSEWDLYYVLLVEEGEREGVLRRCGLGKIYKTAFANSLDPGYGWREFMLE